MFCKVTCPGKGLCTLGAFVRFLTCTISLVSGINFHIISYCIFFSFSEIILIKCRLYKLRRIKSYHFVLYSWQEVYQKINYTAVLRIRIRDLGSGAFLTPGSGIRNRFFPDPGSRIPNPYFWELGDNCVGKKFYHSLKIGPNFFLQHSKTKIFCNFEKFVAS